jgi:tRNA(fMet)-specific endonuclease VapC
MTYLLDTNVCIAYLNGRSSNVVRRLRNVLSSEIAVCSVVKAELFYGAMRSRNPARTLAQQQLFLDQFISLPFDDRSAEFYARIRASLAARGTPIGPNDLLIAAIARAHNLILVTANVREFGRIDELRLENWADDQ